MTAQLAEVGTEPDLAAERAALRKVATFVARDSSPDELFAVVVEQVAEVFDIPHVGLVRYDPQGSVVVAGFSETDHELFSIGSRWPLGSPGVIDIVRRTGRPARVDLDDVSGEIGASARPWGMRSLVANPIVVERRLWGAMVVSLAPRHQLLSEDIQARLADFTELVAAAIANADARGEVERLADEQAALRGVATLVALDAASSEIFAAVSAAVDRVFRLEPGTFDVAGVVRFEPGPELAVVGVSRDVEAVPLGSRFPPDDLFAPTRVLRTGRSARVGADDLESATTEVADVLRHHVYLSQVASPIVVDGRLWGAVSVISRSELPPDTEKRLEKFTELVATAIANAERSAELVASRRRIIAASDDARRRIERDLHDGVQQHLVSLGLDLAAMNADPPTGEALKNHLTRATEDVRSVLDALMKTARGIHPAILSDGGLAAALRTLARRSTVPVELHAAIDGQLPEEVEVATYYVAAEAITNTAKHARASVMEMYVTTDDSSLTLIARDDGIGGADPGEGSGLIGLQDRVEALGGTIEIVSRAGSGTSVIVRLPIAAERGPVLRGASSRWLECPCGRQLIDR
jgi:signal transduction histidine kinase